MRVFIGYVYNERDKWIEDFVTPLATAFGHRTHWPALQPATTGLNPASTGHTIGSFNVRVKE